MILRLFFLLIFFSASLSAKADYVAKNAIYGFEDRFAISDKQHVIYAVKDGKNAKIQTIPNRYKSVDNFNGSLCVIKLKQDGFNVASIAINAVSGAVHEKPVFFSKDGSGKLVEVDVYYLSFPCYKVN